LDYQFKTLSKSAHLRSLFRVPEMSTGNGRLSHRMRRSILFFPYRQGLQVYVSHYNVGATNVM